MREDWCIGGTHRGEATRFSTEPCSMRTGDASPRINLSRPAHPISRGRIRGARRERLNRLRMPRGRRPGDSAGPTRPPHAHPNRIACDERLQGQVFWLRASRTRDSPSRSLVEISGTSRGAIDGPSQRRVRVGFESASLIRTSTTGDTHSHRLPFDDAIRAPPGNRESRLPPDARATIWDCR